MFSLGTTKVNLTSAMTQINIWFIFYQIVLSSIFVGKGEHSQNGRMKSNDESVSRMFDSIDDESDVDKITTQSHLQERVKGAIQIKCDTMRVFLSVRHLFYALYL